MDNSLLMLRLNYAFTCNIQHSEEVKAIVTYLFGFIHGLQNGHIQLFESRQNTDILSHMWNEVLWRRRGFVKYHGLCLISTQMNGIFHAKEIN